MCYGHLIFLIFALKYLSVNSVPDYKVEDYKKIIFFNEILQQVEQPLKYEKWKQRGDQLQLNKDFYKEYNDEMQKFQQDYKTGELLEQQNFFGALIKRQHKQAEGLFHLLYQPLDWETFVQNACWARKNVNAQMFVYVFIMATLQRHYEHAMFLPKIYEIVPRYFLNEDFVKTTETFESGDMLILQTLSELTNKANLKQANVYNVWQWWKQIEPYDQSWHALNKSVGEINAQKFWWHPVDYTRNEALMNEHAKLSYFTEDVDWNAYWLSLNLHYPNFLENSKNSRRAAEFWLYCVQQLMTRYELERWSLDLAELESFDWQENFETGYKPFMKAANGVSYAERENYAKLYNSMETSQMLLEARAMFERIEAAIELGYYFNGTLTNLNETEIVANMLQANRATFAEIYASQWYRLAHMFLTQSIDRKSFEVQPHVLLNYETMLRDPLFYSFHKRIIEVYASFRAKLPAYKADELHSPTLHILAAQLSSLETYFDLFDLDVSNLAYTKSSAQRWSQILLARQLRLTHKPFHLNVTIAAEKAVTVMLRIFLITAENEAFDDRKFLELNKIILNLAAGENVKSFSYEQYFSRQESAHTQDNLYLKALNAEERERLWRRYDAERYCGLSHRLLLPRGTPTGMPMRLFLIVNELSDEDENRHIWWRLCMPLKGQRAFGFPFDREVDEALLNSTNMYWKDVLIYHRDKI